MFGIENLLFAAFTAMSAALLAVSVIAYRRSTRRKLLFLSGVFVLFLAKGVLISAVLFGGFLGLYELVVIGAGIDTMALMMLYVSTMRV